MSAITALSAPGKVLLTGGYLVLDRDYTGTVFALDARIHAVVQQLRRPPPKSASSPESQNKPAAAEDEKEYEDIIIVRSPQFVNAIWEYGIQRHDNRGGVSVIQKSNG